MKASTIGQQRLQNPMHQGNMTMVVNVPLTLSIISARRTIGQTRCAFDRRRINLSQRNNVPRDQSLFFSQKSQVWKSGNSSTYNPSAKQPLVSSFLEANSRNMRRTSGNHIVRHNPYPCRRQVDDLRLLFYRYKSPWENACAMRSIFFIIPLLTAFTFAYSSSKTPPANMSTNSLHPHTINILDTRATWPKIPDYWCGVYWSDVRLRLEFHYSGRSRTQFPASRFRPWINAAVSWSQMFETNAETRYRPLYLDHQDPFIWTVRSGNGVPKDFYLEMQSADGMREEFTYEMAYIVITELRDMVLLRGKRHGMRMEIWDRTRSKKVPGERLVASGFFRVIA